MSLSGIAGLPAHNPLPRHISAAEWAGNQTNQLISIPWFEWSERRKANQPPIDCWLSTPSRNQWLLSCLLSYRASLGAPLCLLFSSPLIASFHWFTNSSIPFHNPIQGRESKQRSQTVLGFIDLLFSFLSLSPLVSLLAERWAGPAPLTHSKRGRGEKRKKQTNSAPPSNSIKWINNEKIHLIGLLLCGMGWLSLRAPLKSFISFHSS